MRVLISGAGIAGLTLATLLSREGKECVVIDRLPGGADLGYVLALWPQGSRVLHALGVHDAFIARSEPMTRYVLNDSRGRQVGTYDMQAAIGQFGHLGIIPRPELVSLLGCARDAPAVCTEVSIANLRQVHDRVEVWLSDGRADSFDLVVGADGFHSRVRELLYGRLPEWDTGWGCLFWWGPPDLTGKGETIEHWGAGRFVGLYPCRQSVGVIVGGPANVLNGHEHRRRLGRVASLLRSWNAMREPLLDCLPDDRQPLYLWRMADVRAPRWVEGRVVLVGDAAAAFLPTAGIGASMALKSAAVLADVLSRTDAPHLPQALSLYVKRRARRVLAAQRQSRWLAKLMFTQSNAVTWMRDRLVRLASMEQMLGPIRKQLEEPI